MTNWPVTTVSIRDKRLYICLLMPSRRPIRSSWFVFTVDMIKPVHSNGHPLAEPSYHILIIATNIPVEIDQPHQGESQHPGFCRHRLLYHAQPGKDTVLVFRTIHSVVQPTNSMLQPSHIVLQLPHVFLQLPHIFLQLPHVFLQPIHTVAQVIEFLNNIPFERTRLHMKVRFVRGRSSSRGIGSLLVF